MDKFIRFFAQRHTLAVLVTTMTVLLGLNSLMTIKRDVFPSVEFGEFFITTIYPGASPEDVELNVTNRIEEELAEVSGLDRYTSYSMENISVVNVLIDPAASDQDDVRREIREAVNRISDFPPDVEEEPDVLEIETAIFPVIEVGLSGEIEYRVLREHAKRLEKELERLPGVSSVVRWGYLDREVKIEVAPNKMEKYQVSLRDIVAAIAARNVRSTGGTFESFTNEKTVVTLAEFETPQAVKDVVVRSTFEGPMIKIRDLAQVTDGFEEARVASRMNGQPAISFFVNKKESADVVRTVDSIKQLLAEIEGDLPDGVEVLYSADMAKYVTNRLRVVTNNGMIGLGLVLLTLTIFLNMRSAFWTAMGIPVTVLGVIFLLPKFDSFLDVISMAAMIQVIGIIVDDAIIIAENIHKYRERGYAPIDAAVTGLQEVFWPVTTTIVTTFIAFAPMFFMSGIMGKFVVVIPLVMSLALFISLFEAIVALPAHLIWGLSEGSSQKVKKKKVSNFDRVRNAYRWSMRHIVTLRYLVVAIAVASLAFSLYYAANELDFVLFPSESADAFYILVEMPTGTSLHATTERMKEIEKYVAALPSGEVESFVTRVGSQGDFQPGQNENWAVLSVNLTPYDARDRIADDIVEGLRAKTDEMEDTRIIYYVDSGGPPVGRPVTLRVIGVDDDVRAALADSVVAYMMAMDGIKDIDRNDKPGKDQVEIRIDYNRLAQVGLTVADVAQNARFAFDGELVTDVRYGDEDVDFRVQLEASARENSKFLKRLLIPNQRGRMIRLGDVASLQTGPGASTVYHYDGERAVMVTSDVVAGVATPLNATNEIMAHFDLANDWPGMRFIMGGEAEETQESMTSLFRAFIIAVIGIYFVLILLFNSPAQPIMVMMAIPFGIMGVILAFALHDADIGFLAMMGVVGLSGIVVNDSLVLVNHINRLRAKHPDLKTRDLVAQGAADRLRAVLLTTITTVVGLLPLAYGIGGSDPFIAPMALALGYGILFATPLTLIVVPCFYAVSEDFRRMLRFGRKHTPVQSEARSSQIVESLLEESRPERES